MAGMAPRSTVHAGVGKYKHKATRDWAERQDSESLCPTGCDGSDRFIFIWITNRP